jgi:hypothetical protein
VTGKFIPQPESWHRYDVESISSPDPQRGQASAGKIAASKRAPASPRDSVEVCAPPFDGKTDDDAGTGDAGTGDAGTGDAGTGDAGTDDLGTGLADTGDCRTIGVAGG